MLVHRKRRLFLSVNVDDIKVAGMKQNMAPMWKNLMKTLILENRHHFLTMCTWVCTQRDRKPNETIIEQYKKMFESRVSAGAHENYQVWEKLHAKTVAWSYDVVGHAQKCVERYCDLANKKVKQLYKVSSLCLDDHQLKQEELKSVGELSEVCLQIVFKYLFLARIVRADILWSVNKLARSVTKWMDSGM